MKAIHGTETNKRFNINVISRLSLLPAPRYNHVLAITAEPNLSVLGQVFIATSQPVYSSVSPRISVQ